MHDRRRISSCKNNEGAVLSIARRWQWVTALVAALVFATPALTAGSATPPIAAKRPHRVESPNGTRVDNYYWLRDDTRKSREVLGYLRAENAYRDALMRPTKPLQQKLYAELVARLKPDDASVPVLEHGYWYYRRYVPGRDYPVYARRKAVMTAPEEVMLDGNAMARGHGFFHVGGTAVSPDGTLLAYTEDDVGRRQYVLRVKNLVTHKVLPDAVTHVSPEVVWAADSRSLLYVENDPVTLLSVRVRRHRLGSPAASDRLIYEEPDHSYYLGVGKSRSERYLFISLESTNQTEWRFADAQDPALNFRPVLPREPNHEYEVEQLGDDFVIRTNWNAPDFRIVRAPIATSADKTTWRDVLPAQPGRFVQDFEVSERHLAIGVREGGLAKIRVRTWDGQQDALIDAREPAYTMQIVDTPGIDSTTLRYTYTSLTTPRTTYDYDMATGARKHLKTDAVLGGFDASNYATEYLQLPARDGRKIPVSLAYRKGTPRDGTAPLYQYAYGSYGISTDPEFAPDWVSLLDRGFVVAIAHVRGGQELGREWYDDGRLLRKKNTFNDFIDVTGELVRLGYAAKDKVFAAGGSAGGLLMGAVANMAPQAYRGIIARVPFVDVVTTMLDDSIPLTSNEYDQWGDPRDKVYYDYMLSYSPYDQVSAQEYPAMLVLTSLWDSQVQYYEPAKWVAKLRAMKTDRHPLVFSINLSGGHGGKSGRFQRYHDTALEYAFVLDTLGVKQ